jgi:hypothetical protein
MTRTIIAAIILILAGNARGQDTAQSGTLKFGTIQKSTVWAFFDSTLKLGRVMESHSIAISSPSGKCLYLDYGNDTLKTSGNLQLDSAAHYFLKYLVEQYSQRIQGLIKDNAKWEHLYRCECPYRGR